jgi:hypothetical protein
LAPLQGFTAGSLRAPVLAVGLLPKHGRTLAPSEVTVPYRVFPVWGSAIAMRFPKPRCLTCSEEHGGCARRVSHPLDALLPPRPAGLIPSRSRVWGSPFEALLRGERRADLSTRQDPHEVSDPLPSAFDPRTGWLGFGPRLSRALLTHRSQPAASGYCTICRCCCLHGLGPSEVCSGLVRRAESPVPLSRFADLSLLIVLAHGQTMGHRRPRGSN